MVRLWQLLVNGVDEIARFGGVHAKIRYFQKKE